MATILLVEDDALMSDLYKTILGTAAHSVTHVTTGAAALAALGESAHELVILDMMMPDMSGMDVLFAMADSGDTASQKVIIFSNLLDPVLAEEALSHGAKRYVVKSDTKPHDFLEIVAEVLADPAPVTLRRQG